jgi:hypothetical protein
MERRRKDPLRYSRIVEGRWKDDEKIHVDILGSTKKDGMMKKRFTALF